MGNSKNRPNKEYYEEYWKMTAAWTDIYGTKFNNSLKVIMVLLVSYLLGIAIYISTKRNYRKNEEHGSAKWGDVNEINKKYQQFPESSNKILTQNVSIGYDGRKHRRNLNTIVIGGSG